MTSYNHAAWQTAPKVKPLQVSSAPYTSPGPNQIVVKNAAVAVNPVDHMIQDMAIFDLKYPAVLGTDVAGIVAEVGSNVTKFKKDDRVIGHAVTLATKSPADGGFQEYTIVQENLAAPIPSNLSFERAVVLPLSVSTATVGLFQKGALELRRPPQDLKPECTGETLLVWGGASSVGSSAIQLAVAAGYDVATTVSPKNFDYVKKLGAKHVFDYTKNTVVDDLQKLYKNIAMAGAYDAINKNGALSNCLEVLAKSNGKKIAVTTLSVPEQMPSGVEVRSILALSLIDDLELSRAIYHDYLPRALAEGRFIPAPEPVIVGNGLESIQRGLDEHKKGVSAKKVVITL